MGMGFGSVLQVLRWVNYYTVSLYIGIGAFHFPVCGGNLQGDPIKVDWRRSLDFKVLM
jgi:hypothetical protein